MRIDAYTQMQQVYNTNKTKKANANQAYSNSYETSKVDISDFGKSIHSAKQAVTNASDVRTELVDSIKTEIQKGTYDVDAESFANKLFQKYQEQNGLF